MFRRLANGWQLLAVCPAALTVMCSAILFHRPDLGTVHMAIRAAARTSLVFIAASAFRFSSLEAMARRDSAQMVGLITP
jgi:hypothetical protein